jgi:hypothetical protein
MEKMIENLVKLWSESSQSHLKTELLLLFARISNFTENQTFLQMSVKLIQWGLFQKSSIFMKDVLILWQNVIIVS